MTHTADDRSPLDELTGADDWRTVHIEPTAARTVTEAMVLLARRAAEKALEPQAPTPPPEGVNGHQVLQPQGVPWAHISRLLGMMIPWLQKSSGTGPRPKPFSREADLFFPHVTAGAIRWAYDELARVVDEPAQLALAGALHQVPIASREKSQGIMAVWMHLIATAKAHAAALPQVQVVDGPSGRQLAVQVGNIMQPVSQAQAAAWQQERMQVVSLREMLIYEATVLSYRLTGLDWRQKPAEPAQAQTAQEKPSA